MGFLVIILFAGNVFDVNCVVANRIADYIIDAALAKLSIIFSWLIIVLRIIHSSMMNQLFFLKCDDLQKYIQWIYFILFIILTEQFLEYIIVSLFIFYIFFYI